MKQVFLVFRAQDTVLIKRWVQSWEEFGWTPRLLLAGEVQKHGLQQLVKQEGGGEVCDNAHLLNFGRRPHTKKWCTSNFPRRGWKNALLVQFPRDFRPIDITNAIYAAKNSSR